MRDSNRWIVPLKILLLLALFGQAVMSMAVKSPTVDEQAHLTRGYLYLELRDIPFKLGHPIFASALNALPVWASVDLSLPSDPAFWRNNRWGEFADKLIWQSCENVDTIFFLGRYVTVALGLLFAALVCRWASQLWDDLGGLLALGLFVFDPNIVAHSRLITGDVAVSLFFFAASYCLWKYLETARTRDLVAAGVTFGLAQGCKFSALILVPALSGMMLLWMLSHDKPVASVPRWLVKRAVDMLLLFLIGGLTIWAIYGFEFRPLTGSSIPIPATSYFEDVIWEMRYFGRTGYVFLDGNISSDGWWYYFLYGFFIKSPLPVLIVIAAAVLTLQRPVDAVRLWILLLPAAFYAASTLIVRLNIGYRLLMPVLPYLYVLAAGVPQLLKRRKRIFVIGTLIWSGLIALRTYPDYLSYFNLLAGGPDNGYKHLVDSNIDWGQDLPSLRRIIADQDLGTVKLSYFGTAHPSCYDIDFEPLPTWSPAPEQGNPAIQTYTPYAPPPGVYAISATNLQGVVFEPERWDTFEWFRTQEPFAKAGYSIFLYQVQSSGPPVDVALSGVRMEQLSSEILAQFGANDLRLRWFDASTSFVVPSEPGWVIAGSDIETDFAPPDGEECFTTDSTPCVLYPPDSSTHAAVLERIDRLRSTSQAWTSAEPFPSTTAELSDLRIPVGLGGEVSFLGYEIEIADEISVSTVWRIDAQPSGPRRIFIHVLSSDGIVASQWDGLDVLVEGWHIGDTIIQRSTIPLPDDAISNSYWLQVGIYNPATLERLPVLSDEKYGTDRILLQTVSLRDEL